MGCKQGVKIAQNRGKCVLTAENELTIRSLIARFANSFDLKRWEDLRGCLADQLHTDYSDLRGTPPEEMSAARFVELRKTALQELQTQHLAGNVELAEQSGEVSARVSMVICRRDNNGQVLNTHCLYLLGLQCQGRDWKIASVVQKVYWSDGNTAIHRGITK
jgi:hypothetical protein